jgi:hypothetical protein
VAANEWCAKAGAAVMKAPTAITKPSSMRFIRFFPLSFSLSVSKETLKQGLIKRIRSDFLVELTEEIITTAPIFNRHTVICESVTGI